MDSEFVYVPVPAEQATAVFQLLAELGMKSEDSARSALLPEETDEQLFKRMYFESHPNHRKLLLLFSQNHGRSFTTEQVADALQLKSGARGAGGMFGAFGRRAKNRYGGRTPWRSEWDNYLQVVRHMMDRTTALSIWDAALEAGDVTSDFVELVQPSD